MNKFLLVSLLFIFLGVGLAAGGKDGKFVTEIDEKDFKATVLDSKIPVFVDFWAPWCGPCRIVGPIVEDLAKKYDGKVKFVKVNVDNNQALAGKYKVRGIPSMQMFKNGKFAEELVGSVPKDEIEKLILKNSK